MKKSFVAWILACCMLLPACDLGLGTDSGENWGALNSELSTTESTEKEEDGDEGEGSGNGSGSGAEPCAEHVDSNDDEKCDECKENVLRSFDFYAVNDVHGKFATSPNYTGLNKMSSYLRQAKQSNPNTVLLASGDMLQGCYESNLTHGKILTDWMNELDFAAMTLGNHEYDWGEDAIRANAALAEYPLLAINVYDKATNQRVDYCDASVLVEQNGAKIGIIGAEGNVTGDIAPEKIENLDFKVGDDLTNLVKAEATRLRDLGADCIVYSIHDGPNNEYEYYDRSLSSYVDIVFEAHTHQTYVMQDNYGVYHLQSGGDNKVGLSHATINVNVANEKTDVTEAETVWHSEYASLADDPVIATLQTKYTAEIASGLEVLGNNESELDSDEILSLASRAYYEAGSKKWSDKQIVFGGGYIGVRFPYKLAKGKIIYGDLLNVLPFDNEVQLCSVNGSDLKAQFIDKSNYRNYYSDYGNSIKSNPVATDTYYIVIDSYCASSTMSKAPSLKVVETYATAIYARDLLAELIKEGILNDSLSTISIAEALAIGGSLGDNATTPQKYLITGRITEILDSANKEGVLYGNMWIEDCKGSSIYVFGSYDTSGNMYGNMADKPKVGDIITLQAPIYKYVKNATTPAKTELMNATVVGFNTPITIPQALTLAGGLASGSKTQESYYVYGTVDEVRSSGVIIKDTGGNKIYVYKPSGASSAMKVGEALVFYGKLQKFTGTQADQQLQLSAPTLYAVL